ncbi:molybdenum cofactor guanylyltransferase MobA [Telmatospirillum siberiense]|uniref:Molybdenum cofactor guanylyltransferase n=1 Tax=Telmatospirillum siberiense TaxID=382514 RepID=A0A2N3PM13_9PROT|nr:molybdenum cofactor guanylyltransferase MobA [Telmatospirillum siberiense]PKU21443.1 molybdenum cofactor guanylyltransferase MobA [Telmatospirillum siberiense]
MIPAETPPIEPVAAVLLAGGLARRMGGGDKMLLDVAGKTLLQRAIERIQPQVGPLLLNANGDPSRFAGFGLPVRADVVAGYAGPLAGILTGMEWLRETRPDIRWLLSLPTDTPMLPMDLVVRLRAAVEEEKAEIGCARSGGMLHPVFGLWPVHLADALRHALVEEEIRKIGSWIRRYKVAEVTWSDDGGDPFLNLNTPDDLDRYARREQRTST